MLKFYLLQEKALLHRCWLGNDMAFIREWLMRCCEEILVRLYAKESGFAFTVEAGDVYWCEMPISKQQLLLVPPGHRVRPFVIVDKCKGGFYGYTCTSGDKNLKRFYFIDKKQYGMRKSSYVMIDKKIEIPYGKVRSYYYHLKEEDYLQMLAMTKREETLSLPEELGIGSIVQSEKRLFYIYQVKKRYFLAHELLLEKPLHGAARIVACKQGRYYIDFFSEKRFKVDAKLEKVMQLSRKDCKKLEQEKSSL